MQRVQMRSPFGRPGPTVIGLIVANVVCYVLQLLLLRAGLPVEDLYLQPSAVWSGAVWQLLTSLWLHSPAGPGHLLMNMLWLFMFGSPMERIWGPRRLLWGYLIFGLSGALFTLVVGSLPYPSFLMPFFDSAFTTRTLGASGAVTGITVAWGLAHAKSKMNFFLLGEMTGMTFVWLVIGIELLTALSFSQVSSTSHLGGILGAFVLCRGLWRPSRWKQGARRLTLLRRKKQIEKQLRVLSGGRDDLPN